MRNTTNQQSRFFRSALAAHLFAGTSKVPIVTTSLAPLSRKVMISSLPSDMPNLVCRRTCKVEAADRAGPGEGTTVDGDAMLRAGGDIVGDRDGEAATARQRDQHQIGRTVAAML